MEIPLEIGNLINLHTLFLDGNQLASIPESIGNLANLNRLWLSYNNLSGPIPESICNLTNLDWAPAWDGGYYAYLYSNELCPPYPSCIEVYVGAQDTSGCTIEVEYLLDLHEGSNLISFALLPEDNSVESVLSSDNILAIAGEGEAAMNTGTGWVGSLTNILYENGYWLLVNDDITLTLTGIPIDPDQQYALHEGNNLISYPLLDCGSIDEVLPDDIEDSIFAIGVEGIAAVNTGDGWIGGLTS